MTAQPQSYARGPPPESRGARSLRTQQCAQTTDPLATRFPHPTQRRYSPAPHETTRPMSAFHPSSNHPETLARDMALDTHRPEQASSCQMLLRKEVIQPHLPVRLPCYDFVPIASPTFDGSPPQGVRPPASGVTDFRDVTGGVYKARERIHRSVADLRLLATPTSRGRVADPDPN